MLLHVDREEVEDKHFKADRLVDAVEPLFEDLGTLWQVSDSYVKECGATSQDGGNLVDYLSKLTLEQETLQLDPELLLRFDAVAERLHEARRLR